MGGHRIDEKLGRQWQSRRAADYRAEQQRRLGSSGAAGPCKRLSAAGEVVEVIEPSTARRSPEAPVAPPLAAEALIKCPHCAGLGRVRPEIDPVALRQLLIAEIGTGWIFTTSELVGFAKVVGGPLRTTLAGRDAKVIGWALKAAEALGAEGGYRLERVGSERARIALWHILPVS